MNNDIVEQYNYLAGVCIQSRAALFLGKKIYYDYIDDLKESHIILIDALFRAVGMDLARILDHDDHGINVHKFLATYQSPQGTKMTFSIDSAAVERLRKRRNKSFAHADIINLKADISTELPLYIGDLESILKSLEDLLFPLSKEITGISVGVNQELHTWDSKTIQQIKVQYIQLQNILQEHHKMGAYMKEHCEYELFRIIYDNGEANDGQT